MIHHQLHHLRKHKNILYGYVILLFGVLLISFITMIGQVTKISSELDKTKKDFQILLSSQAEKYDKKINDSSFLQDVKLSNLSRLITQQQYQQSLILKDLSSIKSSNGDFSSVVESALNSVVSIGTASSTGTGFIIHPNGFIITNNHVISNESIIAVLSHDGKVNQAQLVGIDVPRDLAILYVPASNFTTYLSFGDSSKVQPGQKVVAIGNPLGFSFSVSEGIVSGLSRAGPTGVKEYIQTDVSLNPGNSGGPLIDKDGKVIGVANFKAGDSEGISFALESNSVKLSINSILNRTLFA